MTDPSFIDNLRRRLLEPLPGDDAHQKMKARRSNGAPIIFPPPKDPKRGAVLILLYKKKTRWHFPIIRRSEYDGVHGGQIGLPGGKVEKSDKGLDFTALREAHEEIGIILEDVEVLGSLSSFFVGASNYQVLPVVGKIDYVPTFFPDGMEVAEVIEVPIDDFLNESNRKEKEIEVRGYSIIAPYFDVKSQFIWGATAMMLSELVTILEEL